MGHIVLLGLAPSGCGVSPLKGLRSLFLPFYPRLAPWAGKAYRPNGLSDFCLRPKAYALGWQGVSPYGLLRFLSLRPKAWRFDWPGVPPAKPGWGVRLTGECMQDEPGAHENRPARRQFLPNAERGVSKALPQG